ncbi:hypothetical protein Avbf_15591 [Armadillidium vulgare]|nr:hypothetical protein Avbf_15591 [Armadillidium vulgare]
MITSSTILRLEMLDIYHLIVNVQLTVTYHLQRILKLIVLILLPAYFHSQALVIMHDHRYGNVNRKFVYIYSQSYLLTVDFENLRSWFIYNQDGYMDNKLIFRNLCGGGRAYPFHWEVL